MQKVILCSKTRNHLRFLIPLIETLCLKNTFVLLYCSVSEIANDSINSKLYELQHTYITLKILDLSAQQEAIDFSKDANSLLVTEGTSNQYHKFDYELCKQVSCKSFTIQHGISQEGITRLPQYHFSSDYVFTWVKEEYILPDVTTPKEKFIPIGVPNHYYEKIDKIEDAKIFLFTNGFDKPNDQDLKLNISKSEWSGIYTEEWKNSIWNSIEDMFGDDNCFFVRHPTCIGGDLHPTLKRILTKQNKTLVDNVWLQNNNINRSQLYSLGSKYYVTYPSSCFIDCALNGLDYEVYIDYNGNVPVLSNIKEVLVGLNVTEKISNILRGD